MSTLPWPIDSAGGGLGEGATLTSPSSKPMVQPSEPMTDGVVNRGVWALAENVRHIWERMTSSGHPLAQTKEDTHTTTANESGYTLPYDVYVGQATTSSAADIIQVLDSSGATLQVSGVDVTVSDIKEAPTGVSVFKDPTHFYSSPWVEFSTTIPSGTTYTLRFGEKSDLDSLDVEALLYMAAGGGGGGGLSEYNSVREGVDATSAGDQFVVAHPQSGRILDNEDWASPPSVLASLSSSSYNSHRVVTDGTYVAVADFGNSTVDVFKCENGSAVGSTITAGGVITALAISDGQLFVGIISGGSGAVEEYKASTGSLVTTYTAKFTVANSDSQIQDLAVIGDYFYGIQNGTNDSSNDFLLEWEIGTTAYRRLQDLGSGGVFTAVDVHKGVVGVAGIDGTDLLFSMYTRPAVMNSYSFYRLDQGGSVTPYWSPSGHVISGFVVVDTNRIIISEGNIPGSPWRTLVVTFTYAGSSTTADIESYYSNLGGVLVFSGDAVYGFGGVGSTAYQLFELTGESWGPSSVEDLNGKYSTSGVCGFAADQDALYVVTGSGAGSYNLRKFLLPRPKTTYVNTSDMDYLRPYPSHLKAHPVGAR